MEEFPDEKTDRDDDEENVPDPEDEIDLLVENVDRQSAEAGHSHHVSTGTEVSGVAGDNFNCRT